jgi:glycosyltransferase involved in cell wall biosynthesis
MTSILIDATHLAHAHPSGVEQYVDALLPVLVPELLRMGYAVTLVAHTHRAPAWLPTEAAWLYDRHIPGWGLTRVPWLLKTRGFTHYFTPSGMVPLIPLARQVMTVHDISVFRSPESYGLRERLRLQYLFRQSVRATAAVIAPSRFTANELERVMKYPRARIAVIPHAVPAMPVSAPIKLDYLMPASPLVVCIGRMVAKKQIIPLLHGFATAVRSGMKAQLVFAGSPGYGYQEFLAVHQSLEPEIAQRITLRSFIEPAEKEALYQAADVVVVPGPHEGFGFQVIEALERGIPVLGADSGAVPEVLGDFGITVTADSPAAWADALPRILEKETQMRLRKHIAEDYQSRQWQQVATETAQAIVNLVH